MLFGISSVPVEFQRRPTEGLVELTGVTVVADDLLVYGTIRQQHDNNLCALLERATIGLRTIGFKFNQDECKFLQDQLPYISYLLISDGVRPDPKKIHSIDETTLNPTKSKTLSGTYHLHVPIC